MGFFTCVFSLNAICVTTSDSGRSDEVTSSYSDLSSSFHKSFFFVLGMHKWYLIILFIDIIVRGDTSTGTEVIQRSVFSAARSGIFSLSHSVTSNPHTYMHFRPYLHTLYTNSIGYCTELQLHGIYDCVDLAVDATCRYSCCWTYAIIARHGKTLATLMSIRTF